MKLKWDFTRGQLARFDTVSGGGIWTASFWLPNDHTAKFVLEPESFEQLKAMKPGLYEYGKLLGGGAPRHGNLFPIPSLANLVYAGLDDIPSSRLLAWFKDDTAGIILERRLNGDAHHILVRHILDPILQLGDFWYQGVDPLGPIAIMGEPVEERGVPIARQDARALVWPKDAGKHAE